MLLKRSVLVLLTFPLLVAGCDGYEMVKTDKYFPYGNERTAGSGYAYVLKKMLPEKDVKLEVVERDWEPKIVEALPKSEPVVAVAAEAPIEPMKKADKIFLDAAKK